MTLTRDLKFAQGKLRGGGVGFIHWVHQDGRIETVKNKYEMEMEITKANKNCCRNTPLDAQLVSVRWWYPLGCGAGVNWYSVLICV